MDKPESNEEEISLTGPAPKAQPKPTPETKEGAKEPEPAEETGYTGPQIGARQSILNIPANASDADVLAQVINTPEEKFFAWELVELPSGGLFYGWQDGTINVRPITQTGEKALATQRLAATGQSLDYLFRECCQFPNNFDPIDMLLGDRMYLLYYLRGITHGNIYEFIVPCPNQDCQQSNMHSYDLNLLAGTIKRANPQLGKEPFKIVLPYLSAATGRDFWISVRFLRGTDQNTMLARRKQVQSTKVQPGGSRNPLQRKQQQARELMKVDDTITENLQQIIVNVMGNNSPQAIYGIVSKLHATDSAAIREWLRVNTPGIDATISVTCPDCEHRFTVELPITETFFRPQSAGTT